jgi:outer membrane receptor protein involved in Fe transport
MVRMLARHLLSSLTLVLLLALVAKAQAQTTGRLTGTVTDPQSGVIPGAVILAKNARTGSELRAVANEVGVWVIRSVPSGSYMVNVSAQAFRTATFEEIEIDAGATATVNATLQIGFANTVVVTASRFDEEVINAPATVSVVSERTIQALPSQNLADLLRAVPGMNVAQTSANIFGVTSRAASGALPSNQLVLLDGRTMYQDYFGYTSWDGMQTGLDDIKQVEVIHGPASAVWGSYAMNGVVNIITKPPREMLGTTFTLGIGTFDRSGGAAESNTGSLYYARVAHAQALNDRWAFNIKGGAYTQDAFARPQGTFPNEFHTPYPPYTNKGTTQPKVDARIDYDHPDGKQHFNFAGGYASTSGIIPGAAGGADIDGMGSYGKVDYVRGDLRITAYVNALTFSGKFLLGLDPSGRIVRFNGKSLTYHVEFGNFHMVGTKHLISYGGNLRHSDFNISYTPEARSLNEGGAYLQDEILLSRYLRWVVGARIDKFSSLKGAVVSPRTTFMVKPARGQTFRVSYNRAYLAPSVYWTDLQLCGLSMIDLGLIDPQLAGNYFSFPGCFSGNRGLKEQSLNAYEVGYTALVAKDRVSLGAAFYINDSRGDFYWPQTGSYTSRNPPPGWPLPLSVLDALIAANAFGPGMGLPSLYTATNRGEVRNKGIELSADTRIHRYITGFANYSWQARPESKEFDIFGINLPPTHRFNAGINFEYKRYLGNVSVGYVGSAYWNDILSIQYSGSTKAYTVVNAGGGVRWGEGRKYTAMLKISNLANTPIQNHVYGDILKRQIAGEFKVRF